MKFGTIFGMDYEPTMRLMALGPKHDPHNPSEREIWNSIVLVDPATGFTAEGRPIGWDTGILVTFDPLDRGITIIETPEEPE